MTKLRLVAYRDLSRVTEMAGFHWVRSEGSHNIFRNHEGRIVVIPDHGSQVIVRPLLRKILRDMGLGVDEYNRLLGGV
ncbi:MAG: type II toxin-antitoxin system HicA family toxin [Chloroflexi bacterium]|nr:type II toxin-antitoxin system HicA family toxin [Chloroflexota bacterium]